LNPLTSVLERLLYTRIPPLNPLESFTALSYLIIMNFDSLTLGPSLLLLSCNGIDATFYLLRITGRDREKASEREILSASWRQWMDALLIFPNYNNTRSVVTLKLVSLLYSYHPLSQVNPIIHSNPWAERYNNTLSIYKLSCRLMCSDGRECPCLLFERNNTLVLSDVLQSYISTHTDSG